MSEIIPIHNVNVLSFVGFHDDGWCEPICSARFRGVKDLDVGTMAVWIQPLEDAPKEVILAIQVDRDEPFVVRLLEGSPTLIGFPVNRPAGKVFALTLSCDRIREKVGEDVRTLSFHMSRLHLCSADPLSFDDALQLPGAADPVPTFAKPIFDGAGDLRGALKGVRSGIPIRAEIDGKEVASATSGHSGEFSLPIGRDVAGHDETCLKLVAGDGLAEQHIALLLDPRLVGRRREKLAPPRPAVAPATELAGKDKSTANNRADAPAPSGSGTEVMIPLVEALTAQTQALRTLLTRQVAAGSALLSNILAPGVDHLSERYGVLLDEVSAFAVQGPDIIWLGVIDWEFRVQRPQHLALELGRLGCRIFYISIVFGEADGLGRFHIVKSHGIGVYEIKLKLACPLPPNIYRELDRTVVNELLRALDELASVTGIKAPTVVVQYPSWAPVAFGIPGATVVHDCLDLVSGFTDTPKEIVALEEHLVANADIIVTTSKPLQDLLAKHRSSELIRNGADVHFFAQATTMERSSECEGKVVGYFGAISDWFEVEWIVEAASEKPEWTFVLIGSTAGADVSPLKTLTNVKLLGELYYQDLPKHLASFDAAIIPFKLVDLILCTNPVKLYEYMAAGKPVVASAMPEAVIATDLVYIAADAADFTRKLQQALDEDSKELRAARMAWAREHDWSKRAEPMRELIDQRQPKVSVIVLSYMNWAFTEATLRSVLAFSDYDNLEILVVDNGSNEAVVYELQRFVRRDPRMKLILNGKNLGYAAGNNVGLRAATGDFTVLLNNDTYVTKGWIADLIRPLKLNPKVGLVSPTTNNIGNEQKVSLQYRSMEEMARSSRAFVRQHARERFETDSVAFFCAATRRDVIEEVGLLDEEFGLGFFEDDDFCQRVLAAGYSIQIVDDVFVHHHLSASFDQLPTGEKKALLERNKAIFEKRWGTWRPHSYRNTPGFG